MMEVNIFLSDQTAANAKPDMLILPPELRMKIFEMVIGARRWHIQSNGNESGVYVRECHLRDASGAVDPLQQCLQPYDRGTCDPERQNHEPRSTNTTLLLVCRQFYGEAAKVKWQNHVFQVIRLYPHRLRKFIRQLSDWQFKAIRTLHVHYGVRLRPDHSMWQASLHMVSEMTGLRRLIINPLMTYRIPESREETWKMIRPQLIALCPLNMNLTGVLILVCPLYRAFAPLHSFIDLTEFWRECMVESRDKYKGLTRSEGD